MNDRFTATQQRILVVLADGYRHRREELRLCLGDEQADLHNLQSHLTNIRPTLRKLGQDIVCELYQGTIYYRHVRLLASSYGE